MARKPLENNNDPFCIGGKKRFVEREDKEINLGEGDMEEQDEELKK